MTNPVTLIATRCFGKLGRLHSRNESQNRYVPAALHRKEIRTLSIFLLVFSLAAETGALAVPT